MQTARALLILTVTPVHLFLQYGVCLRGALRRVTYLPLSKPTLAERWVRVGLDCSMKFYQILQPSPSTQGIGQGMPIPLAKKEGGWVQLRRDPVIGKILLGGIIPRLLDRHSR